MRQIEVKKYYVPYMEQDLNLLKIGVIFGEKERNIIEWKVEV